MKHVEEQDEHTDRLVSILDGPDYYRTMYELGRTNPELEFPVLDVANPECLAECVQPSDVPMNFGHYSYLLEKDGFTERCTMVAKEKK